MGNKIFKKAFEHFHQKNYWEAKDLLLSLSNKNTTAQYYLGIMYRVGLGLEQNQKEAFGWFLKAAEHGHAESQYLVGCSYTCSFMFMHSSTDIINSAIGHGKKNLFDIESVYQGERYFYPSRGMGVEEDMEKAMWWLEASADQGCVEALTTLGCMYSMGLEVQRNETKAFPYLLKAASSGSALATLELGLLELNYHKNLSKGLRLLRKAYALGDERSPYYIGEEYEYNKEDYREAFEWYSTAVLEFNCCDSKFKLGEFYREGKGVEKDIDLAIFWYKKVIEEHKDEYGHVFLGETFERLNDLIEEGYENALSGELYIGYLRSEATLNSKDDYFNVKLREYHEKGYNVGDFNASLFTLLKKAEQGDKQAQIEFGHSFIVNLVVWDSTRKLAIDWYLEDAESGAAEAQYLLSQAYYGSSFRSESDYWLHKAANQGYSDAHYDLAFKYRDDCPGKFIEHLEIAAESNLKAQIELGNCYAHENSVHRNYAKAYTLYQSAAKQLQAISDISKLVVIKHLMIYFDAGNDEAEILAQQGDENAQLYMGCLYQYGFEVKRNLDKAIYWYEKASKQDCKEANLQLSLIAEEGSKKV